MLSGCSAGGQVFVNGGGGGGTVTTVPPPGLSISISPTVVSVLPNGTVSFSAQVSNDSNTAVTYTVNGVPGGNSTVGTIGGSSQQGASGTPPGAYTAPAVPPVPNTVIVTATSVADPSKSASALVVITNPPVLVTVTVTPSLVALLPGATTAFTAGVTGTTNTALSWAVNGISGGNATVGTITQAGIYTAPLAPPSPPTVTVTATSLADPNASGQAVVNIQQQVAVSVMPTVANVVTGMSLNFSAVVTGSLNTNVLWSVAGVAGGNSTVGSIGSSNGVYTAPAAVPTPATVTVTATSVADPTMFASAQLTIIATGQVGVSVAPSTTVVAVNGTQQFMATVVGTTNTGVTWSLNGAPTNGTISSTGLYSAPSVVPFPNTVTITATSLVANVSGTATVQVTAFSSVNVNVAPAATTIQTNSAQQFTATVTGTTTTTVTWSVNGLLGGNNAVGTISLSGLYTAPGIVPSPPTVMITATSTASPSSSGSAALTIAPPLAPVVVNITPISGSLKVASRFQFSATVSGAPAGQSGVTWSVNGVPGGNASVGTITAAGLYVAPASAPTPAVVNVTATSQFQPSCGPPTLCMATSNITILPFDTISMTPTAVHVQVNLGAQFFVTVTGLINTAVTFKINGIPGGNSVVGTISTGGLYFAPAQLPATPTVTLTATSVADPSLVATSTITIDPSVTVVVNPAAATLSLGGTQTFAATVTGTTNTGVTWSVNNILGGNSTVGTINQSTGVYTAPASLLFTTSFTITAASVVNPSAQGSALATVNVNTTVVVSPATATVAVNGTLTFAATVTGNSNTAVNWIVVGPPNPGTINALGVYTAPNTVPAGTVIITAQSQAIPTATGTATVTVTPVVSITLTPSSATVNTGATQLFTATVMNTPNTAVTWTVNGIPNGNTSVGVIDPVTGIYTAPNSLPTPPTVTVTATSVADPTKSASAIVTVQPVVTAITVSPPSASIATSATQQFAAMVTGSGNTAVTWQVNGTTGGNINTVGSISTSGLYTAPNFNVVTTATNFTITAVSVQNNTVSGSAMVTVTPPPITVTVSPDPVTLTVNATQQFTATVTGTANQNVTWSVIGSGNGTITASGLYTAPGVPPGSPVTVQANSVKDPTKFDTATVTITNATITVAVSPAKTKVVVGAQQQFTATVTGTANQNVTWSVAGGAANGTISATGLYTAPNAVPSPATVTIVATSVVAPNPTGSTTLTVLPSITVSVSPTSVSLNTGAQQTFTATVTGTTNLAVTWFVNGVVGGNSTVGTISQSTGQYTAPGAVPTPAMVTVSAVSQADPTKSGSATVTIQGVITVTVSPATVGVNINTARQFSATVTNSTMSVTWSISGTGNIGSISPTGLYSAPAAVPSPATVTVTATSLQNGTSMGTAIITVLPVVSVSISPGATTVTPNQQTQFTATVTGSANTAVTWSVNGILGGNSAVGMVSTSGLYTAPGVVPTSPIVTITATSVADPTKSANAAVTISAPGAGIFVSVFPRNRNLPLGRTQQLKSHVFLTTNSAVNWFVNNTQNGNATFGTIDPVTAIYTPPAVLPANPNITIKATSQADPTKSDSQNQRLVLGVVLTPPSASPHITEVQQFVAVVNGSTNQSIEWQVNGIVGGNATIGTITNTGLYAAPASVPVPGIVAVSAVSLADPTEPAVATVKVYGAKIMTVFPTTASVLPGWRVNLQYYTNVVFPSSAPSFKQVVTWSVNGIVGGTPAIGTVSLFGQYTAPPTLQTVIVAAQCTANPSFTAQATITVTSGAGASSSTLLDTWTKVRPYDIISGTPTLSVAAAQQEYADWQLLVTTNGQDLSGVDVNVSNFRDGAGNVIPSSNATIYLEKPLNIFYPSRFHFSDVGEWPDPLVPKVDPFVHETRNAFPFDLNRISPAYKSFPIAPGGNTTSTGLGAGTAKSGGTYTGSTHQRFDVVIDGTGALGTATFKWSTDGGTTFMQTGLKTSASPITLADGVTVSFQAGNLSGVADFNVGDTFWIFAGPLRNQPVFMDLYVPMGTPAGNYTGTVTVTQSGKPPVTLTVKLQVYAFAIPVSSSFPTYFGTSWDVYVRAHFLMSSSSQVTYMGQLYGTACLVNRMTCNASVAPRFVYNANGTISSANYTAFDQGLGPLANGTITPHGEQLTSFNQRLPGTNDSETYFAEQNELAHMVANGWRSRVFDYTYDEPSPPSDFQKLMDRASLVRSVDMSFRTHVTTDISKSNFNTIGYLTRYVPNFLSLGQKDYQRGPLPAGRSAYNEAVLNGTELWFYDSCVSQGCGSRGTIPFNDNYPNSMADTSAIMNRVWGFFALVPYQVTGVEYYDISFAYGQYFSMPLPRVDVWDSIYYFSGNGDGTFFYPGRPANIGGTKDIPIESLRVKQFRDAFVDMEYGLRLQNQGDGNFLATNILQIAQDLYTYDPNPASWANLRKVLGPKIK